MFGWFKKDDHKHIYVRELRQEAPWYTDRVYWCVVWQCAEFGCIKVKKRRYLWSEKELDAWRATC